VVLIVFIAVVNVIQKRKPSFLPKKLRTWEFLPIWLRSLEPYDKKIVSKLHCCSKLKCCRNKIKATENRLEPIIEESTADSEMQMITHF